jgi:hypothetical protein
MRTRAKLIALSLGTLAIALLVWVLLAVPTPQRPPDMVERIDLEAPRSDEQRGDGGTPVPTAGRQRPRSRRGDRRPPVSARRAQDRSGAPTSRSISTGDAGAQAHHTPPDRAVVESPTVRPRSESAPRAGGSPTPRSAPVSGTPPAPRNSAPEVDSPPEPSEPPDPVDAEVTSAAADPPEAPEPVGSDQPEEPEPADGDPLP